MSLASVLEKAFVFLLALAIVAIATVALKEWSGEFSVFLWRAGKLELIIYLTVFTLGLGYILKYLLKLEIRMLAGGRPRLRRYR